MRALVNSIEETMNQSEAALPSSSAINQSEATLPTTSSINQSEPTLPTTSGPLGKKNNKHIKQKTLGNFNVINASWWNSTYDAFFYSTLNFFINFKHK